MRIDAMKINKNRLPHFDSRKEYESPIHEYRVTTWLTIKELAKQANIPLKYNSESRRKTRMRYSPEYAPFAGGGM